MQCGEERKTVIRYLYTAKSPAAELNNQLSTASGFGYLNIGKYISFSDKAVKLSGMPGTYKKTKRRSSQQGMKIGKSDA
jgi:hypothetical protein